MALPLVNPEMNEHSTTTVVLAGELDIASAAEMRDALIEANMVGARRIVVDMGAVTFLDSTALGILVGAHKRATARGATVALRNVPPLVERVLAITGLAQLFATA